MFKRPRNSAEAEAQARWLIAEADRCIAAYHEACVGLTAEQILQAKRDAKRMYAEWKRTRAEEN